MNVSVTDAKAQLSELVRRAKSGEEIILTRRGRATVRLEPVSPEPVRKKPDMKARAAFIDSWRKSIAGKATPGPSAARSQDFLYDEDGLPA